MEVNKEDSKTNIINVDKEKLKTYFYTRANIYSDSLNVFHNLDVGELQIWLKNLSILIEVNARKHTLSQNVKNKLYKILSIFRDKSNDFNILNQINELITLLNKSSEENYARMINNEFSNRVSRITPFKNLVKIKPPSWEYLEQVVILSFMEDSVFFLGLTKKSELEFLEENIGLGVALPSISNLLVNHSEVLKEQALTDRIIKLLNYNISSPKKEDSVFGNLQDSSKICLKKIKKLK